MECSGIPVNPSAVAKVVRYVVQQHPPACPASGVLDEEGMVSFNEVIEYIMHFSRFYAVFCEPSCWNCDAGLAFKNLSFVFLARPRGLSV